MSKLHSCSQCQSFLPSRLSSCPNCGATASPVRRRLVGPLATIGGGVLAMTLSACYGGADDYYPEDTSTRDTAIDMGTDTGGGDTGPADTGSGDAASDAASDASGDAASDASGDAASDAASDA